MDIVIGIPAGECVDVDGKPLTHLLFTKFGYGFVFSYVFSYMLVVSGLGCSSIDLAAATCNIPLEQAAEGE